MNTSLNFIIEYIIQQNISNPSTANIKRLSEAMAEENIKSEMNLQIYSKLINMGFEDEYALQSAQKYNDIQDAVEYIIHNSTDPKHSVEDAIDIEHENISSIQGQFCDVESVMNCIALKRLISLLKIYDDKHSKYDEIDNYLQKYNTYLISDFHHILDMHLNEDRISAIESNNQFGIIYKQMTEMNDLSCDIENCKIYSRNNRQRETMNIDCGDNKLAMFIDIIDSIHCYFLHSIDCGYRIIQRLAVMDEQKNIEMDSNEFVVHDPKMKALRAYLSLKRKNMQKQRGNNRLLHNKFVTHWMEPKVQSNDN